MYLYNLDQQTHGKVNDFGISNENILMMEWKYELPLLFFPLFAGEITKLLTKAVYSSINARAGTLPYGIAIGFRPAGIDIIMSDGSTRPMTAEEAYQEGADYLRSLYSKSEVKQLQEASKSLEEALELLEEAHSYKAKEQYDRALEIFIRSADLGCAEALTNIGHIYETAPAYEDPDKAFEYYLKAAIMGEVYAMTNLALCYMYGRGTAVSLPEAISWLEKAAAKGYYLAYTYLGDIYYLEEFNHTDNEKALQYFLRAQEHGQGVTATIGHIYELQENFEQAAYYYQMGVDAGSGFATWRLGCFYMDGKAVPVSLTTAMELFTDAVDSQPEAYVDLATLYMSDEYYDEVKARQYLEIAREAGISYADEYMVKFGFI